MDRDGPVRSGTRARATRLSRRLAACGTLVLVVAAAACARRPPPRAGDACAGGPGADVCSDPTHLMTCRAFRWQVDPCHGPAGCASGVCDRSVAALDDSCGAIDSRACSLDGRTLLACHGYRMAAIDRCRGERACHREGEEGEPACDHGPPEIGDECVPPLMGSRCGAGGHSILRCSASTRRMELERACRGPHGCVEEKDPAGEAGASLGAGMLSCDSSVRDVGDPCVGPGPQGAFSADGAWLLTCKDGKLARARACPCIASWEAKRDDPEQWHGYMEALGHCPCVRARIGTSAFVVTPPNVFYRAFDWAVAER
jgi:hypothetical protein